MEKILLEAVLRHMEKREVIGDSQHGFTKGKSCLLRWNDYVSGQGKSYDVVYLDFCKAFIMVPNNILLSKLERDGFDG